MFKRIWAWFWAPRGGWLLGGIPGYRLRGGHHFLGRLQHRMELTNTEFCISCHEMRDTVYQEYKTIHYSNRTGVRAFCSDCHVPKDWVHKLARKIQATNELWHKIAGTIDYAGRSSRPRAWNWPNRCGRR